MTKTHHFILILFSGLFLGIAGAQTMDAARLSVLKGEYEQALNELGPQMQKGAPQAYYLAGLASKELRQYNRALTYLQKAKPALAHKSDFLLTLGSVYEGLGNRPQAVKTYAAILKKDSLNRTAQTRLAAVYFKEKKYAAALRLYRELLKRFSRNTYFLRRAGMALFQLKKYPEAARYFQQAVQGNAKDLTAWNYLGKCFLKTEQAPAALQSALNGLRENPQSLSLLKLKADALFIQKSYAPAALTFRKIIDRKAASTDVYKKLGLSNFYLNNFPEALLALQTTVEMDSSDGLSFYYLAMVYKELGNYEKGALYFNRAVKALIPGYMAEVFGQMAYCQDNLKQYGAAIQSYKRALEFAPERKLYLFFIASLYDRFYKDRQTPLDWYQRFIEQAPEAQERYKNYALERMKAIKEELHFKKGRKLKQGNETP